MKTKKALKRLNKVVALLSNVIDKLPDRKGGLGDVLDSAKTNVVRAAKMVHSQPSNGAVKRKAPANTEGRQSAVGRKKMAVAATKRAETNKGIAANSEAVRGKNKTA